MKKILFLLTVGSFAALAVNAQTVSFGLKAGMTSANMKAKSSGLTISTDSKIGFYAGAMAEIGVSENFAVQPELFYSSMGYKISMSEGGETFKGSDNLGYINLPVLLKYKNEGFAAFVGPQISYLISAKGKGDGIDGTTDTKENYKSTDVSGIIGASYTLMSGIGFDARYQMGLTNVAKDADTDESLKNNGFMVGLHYFFNR